jgi:hypothetical protein
MAKILSVVLVAFFVGSCVSPREGTTGSVKPDVLTAAEIATTDAQNAYDAIILKRPFFMKSRGPRSLMESPVGQTAEYPVVYVDGMYYGELESLRFIAVSNIREIDYLDFNAATLRFGTGHTGGVIHVLTKD